MAELANLKYTKEILQPLVVECASVRQVLTKLNLKHTGGNHAHIKSRLEKFEIDTSHFTGQSHSKGKRLPYKKGADHYLRLYDPSMYRIHGHILRRCMIEKGLEEKCSECGIGTSWNDKHLVLPVDHINGQFWDCRIDNLRFVCPNCHSQSETFAGRNINTGM